MITWSLIQGCTFGLELVDGKMVSPEDDSVYLVLDLFLIRAVVNI
jgi:hypothetical protein